MFSDGQVRMKDHMLVSKFQIFDHPLEDVLDENIFLCMLGNVIARKRKCWMLFWKVGGAKVSIDHVRFKTLLGL